MGFALAFVAWIVLAALVTRWPVGLPAVLVWLQPAVVAWLAAIAVGARAARVPLAEVELGAGPRLWSTKPGETTWGIRLAPFGGSVTFAEGVPAGVRMLLLVAGALAPLLLGLALWRGSLDAFAMFWPAFAVGTVTPGSNGAELLGRLFSWPALFGPVGTIARLAVLLAALNLLPLVPLAVVAAVGVVRPMSAELRQKLQVAWVGVLGLVMLSWTVALVVHAWRFYR